MKAKCKHTTDFAKYWFWLPTFCLFLLGQTVFGQQVKTEVDTTTIKIGEQINYTIKVSADASAVIKFPEKKDFLPLEAFEVSPTDTVKNAADYSFMRRYALTQFDSGSYTIPRQRILINNQTFYADSLQIEVRNVAVDTTKQKLFPIKPSVEVEKPFRVPTWLWYTLAALFILGLLTYWLLKTRKKRKEAKRQLPPYEQAKKTLEELDKSQALEHGEVKKYYSVLTEAIRRYLDRKVDGRALESTTNELIAYLKNAKNGNKLYVKDSLIGSLTAILNRADLAKFAGIKPDRLTAKEDRKIIEEHLDSLQQAIPEPTEKDIEKDAAYLEEKRQKRRKKQWIIAGVSGVVIILVAAGIFIGEKGFSYTKDLIFGHPSKELLHGDWITSSYGTPSVKITTPEVLVRQELDSIIQIPQLQQKDAKVTSFAFGPLLGDFHIQLNTVSFKNTTEVDLNKTIDKIYEFLEDKGATNILVKNEEFITPEGAGGIKAFGSFSLENPITKGAIRKEYAILNFSEKGGMEQIILIYNQKDAYAEEMVGRIANSVKFKTDN